MSDNDPAARAAKRITDELLPGAYEALRFAIAAIIREEYAAATAVAEAAVAARVAVEDGIADDDECNRMSRVLDDAVDTYIAAKENVDGE